MPDSQAGAGIRNANNGRICHKNEAFHEEDQSPVEEMSSEGMSVWIGDDGVEMGPRGTVTNRDVAGAGNEFNAIGDFYGPVGSGLQVVIRETGWLNGANAINEGTSHPVLSGKVCQSG